MTAEANQHARHKAKSPDPFRKSGLSPESWLRGQELFLLTTQKSSETLI